VSEHIVSPKIYLAIFLTLMAGTAITVWAAYHNFGGFQYCHRSGHRQLQGHPRRPLFYARALQPQAHPVGDCLLGLLASHHAHSHPRRLPDAGAHREPACTPADFQSCPDISEPWYIPTLP